MRKIFFLFKSFSIKKKKRQTKITHKEDFLSFLNRISVWITFLGPLVKSSVFAAVALEVIK